MPPLSNPKWEEFVQEYLINGGSATQAYAKVYNCKIESAMSAGPSLHRREVIKARIAECQNRVMDMTLKTAAERRQQLLERLDKIIYAKTDDAPRHTEILKAIELQMRALGMLDPQEGNKHNISLHIEGIERQDRDQWLAQNNPQLRPPNGGG